MTLFNRSECSGAACPRRVRAWRPLRTARALVLVLAVTPLVAPAEEEYAIKAGFLFHFLNFVTWPDDVFEAADTPFTLCLVGGDPFGELIEPITSKKAQGRPIRLLRKPPEQNGKSCQVVFITGSGAIRVEELLADWSHRGVLTVGDTEDFAGLGGIIGYVRVGKRLRFVLNEGAAEKASLEVSVKLRKVAVKP